MLSIMGMYNYDPTIFELLTLPESLDTATCINSILINNAELGLIYTDPKIMKILIGNWSNSSQYAWNKLSATLNLEYNPIWNKDGTITETETIEGEGSGSQQTTGEGIEQVSAFDASTFQNRGKNTDTGSASSTAESTSNRTYERVEQGNIGVTSTQQLIKEEREIAEYNIYDAIAADFKNRFCIMVY